MDDGVEKMLETQAGLISALLMVVQALVHSHPDPERLVKLLGEIVDSDVPVVLAMASPGRPRIDGTYRDTMARFFASAQQPQKAPLVQTCGELVAGSSLHEFLLQLVFAERFKGDLAGYDREAAAIRAVAAKPPVNLAQLDAEQLGELHANGLAQLEIFLKATRGRLIAANEWRASQSRQVGGMAP